MRPLLVITLLVSAVHCATMKSYSAARAADLADIVTLSAEAHLYGVQAKAGPINAGLAYVARARGVGLRAGSLGQYRAGAAPDGWTTNGNSFLLLNGSYHDPGGGCRGQAGKAWSQSSATPLVLYEFDGYNGFFQIELAIGLFGGLRAGLNLAEAMDFLFGLIALDPLGDDCPLK